MDRDERTDRPHSSGEAGGNRKNKSNQKRVGGTGQDWRADRGGQDCRGQEKEEEECGGGKTDESKAKRQEDKERRDMQGESEGLRTNEEEHSEGLASDSEVSALLGGAWEGELGRTGLGCENRWDSSKKQEKTGKPNDEQGAGSWEREERIRSDAGGARDAQG
jgi:hypothetical protein